MGLLSFATLSTGEKIDNPRFYRQSEQRLKQANPEQKSAGILTRDGCHFKTDYPEIMRRAERYFA